MIAGIGIDLVEVEKIAASLGTAAFLHKVFTEAEIEDCRSVTYAAERFAGKFAAKEAFMKAIGEGIRQGLWFRQLEVLNKENGAPYVRVASEVEVSLHRLGVMKIHVSITHTRNTAAAVVILEK